MSLKTLGNANSGNFGHAGRPGEIGGSSRGGISSGKITDKRGIDYPILHEEGSRTYQVGPEDNYPLASATLGYDRKSVVAIGVKAHLQRRGIATALYDYIEKDLGYKLEPFDVLSTEGRQFWDHRKQRGDEDFMLRANTEFRYLEALRTAGVARKVTWQGREHWVVPVVALMEGVIHAVNAKDAEFVPYKTFSQNVSQWNGRPLMLGHPVRDGIHIAANEPSVLESACFGSLFNTRIENKRLLMDAYVDPDRLKALGREDVLERVINGQPIEISVGAQVATDTQSGEYNGRAYKNSWLAMAADHLAFLPDGRGACSLEMGCGAHRAMAAQENDMDDETLSKRASAYKDCPICNGSGNTGENPCDACDGSGELKVAEDIKGDEMDKKALITKLVACPCSGFTKDDITALEGFSDARLVTLSETSEARAKEKEAEDDAKAKARAKQDAEDAKLKAAEDAKQTAEQKITALETEMISVRDIVAERRAQDATETTALLATLKVAAANVYTEVELTAMPLPQLRKLALLTKADVPDYSGRGITMPRAAGAVDYNPPNAYDAGIKILQGK